MTTALTLKPATEVALFRRPLQLHRGGTLSEVAVGYERVGRRNAPCVVVLGGITASSHVTAHRRDPSRGWWQDLVGPGRAIDTNQFQLLSFDFVGGAGASTGPHRDQDPDAFPEITSHDQAHVLARLLDRLGIERLHAFVGCSFGGMVGLAFAEHFPHRVGQLITFGAPDRSRVLATAWRTLQRQVLRLGREHGCDEEALALARAIGMTTYSGESELQRRFADSDDRANNDVVEQPVRAADHAATREPAVSPGSIADYLDARGRSFVGRFHSAALAVLSRAVDLHCVSPSRVRVPTTVLTADSDRLVTPAELHAMSQRLPQLRRFVCLRSPHGHDAFLKDAHRLAPILRQALIEGSGLHENPIGAQSPLPLATTSEVSS